MESGQVAGGAASLAGVRAVLTLLQWRALPTRHGHAAGTEESSVPAQWRTVVANRAFLLFALAMIGSYVLAFQIYLALPLAADDALGTSGTTVTSGFFVVSAAVAVAGQLRLTDWAKNRWRREQALVRGLATMGLAFLPLAMAPRGSAAAMLLALVAAVVLLAAGSAVVYPFEMETVVALAGDRLVATHYGLYNTVSGLGITLGNLVTGALWDFALRHDALWLTWAALTFTGLACAGSVAALARSGRLTAHRPQPMTTCPRDRSGRGEREQRHPLTHHEPLAGPDPGQAL